MEPGAASAGRTPFMLDSCKQLGSVDAAATQAPGHERIGKSESPQARPGRGVSAEHEGGTEHNGAKAPCLGEDVGFGFRRALVAEMGPESAHDADKRHLAFAGKAEQLIQCAAIAVAQPR